MGASYEHLKSHVPGQSHEINKGLPELPQAASAKEVPCCPDNSSRERGNRAVGERGNIAPSMDLPALGG